MKTPPNAVKKLPETFSRKDFENYKTDTFEKLDRIFTTISDMGQFTKTKNRKKEQEGIIEDQQKDKPKTFMSSVKGGLKDIAEGVGLPLVAGGLVGLLFGEKEPKPEEPKPEEPKPEERETTEQEPPVLEGSAMGQTNASEPAPTSTTPTAPTAPKETEPKRETTEQEPPVLEGSVTPPAPTPPTATEKTKEENERGAPTVAQSKPTTAPPPPEQETAPTQTAQNLAPAPESEQGGGQDTPSVTNIGQPETQTDLVNIKKSEPLFVPLNPKNLEPAVLAHNIISSQATRMGKMHHDGILT